MLSANRYSTGPTRKLTFAMPTDRRNDQPAANSAAMSLLTDRQLTRAVRTAVDAITDRNSVQSIDRFPVLEQRPWGRLEWSVSGVAWDDVTLEAITINNPSSDKKPDIRRRTVQPARPFVPAALDQEVAPSTAGFALGGFFAGVAVISETSLPVIVGAPGLLAWIGACAAIPTAFAAVRRRRRENLATLEYNGWLPRGDRKPRPRRFASDDALFDELKTLVVAMKFIEEATVSRKLPANLCSPAWASLWFTTGLGRIERADATDRLVAAGRAAERALARVPHAAVSNEELVALWGDRSWWEPIMGRSVAHDRLLRATRLVAEGAGAARGGSHENDAPAPASVAFASPVFGATEADLQPVRLVHQEVREAFTAFCFDPHAVLARPLLNDVSDDLTAAFYAAQEAADEAETALQARPGQATAQAYQRAVEVLATAWDRADIHARECGVSYLSITEQSDVRRARRALDLALNPNTPAGERDAAYRVVMSLLAGLVKVPAPALSRMVGQIDSVCRQQLTDERSHTTDGGGWPSV